MLRDGRVLDIWGEAFSSVREEDRTIYALLQGGPALRGRGGGGGRACRSRRCSLLAPIARPGKIVCIGLNYRSHAEEAGIEPPETPTFFAKYANAHRGARGARSALPATSQKVDYEAEVAFVIGDRCKDVSEEEAMHHVAGYMLLNDLSARDLQFSTPQWMPGKVFDGSAPCGPALVTPDEAGPARRDRDRADAERRDHAVGVHVRPDPLGARAGVAPLGADDARPRRHRRHRHAGRRRRSARAAACGSSPATRSWSPRPSSAS